MRYSLYLSKSSDRDSEHQVIGSELYGYELIALLIRVLVRLREGDIVTIKGWGN